MCNDWSCDDDDDDDDDENSYPTPLTNRIFIFILQHLSNPLTNKKNIHFFNI